MKRLKMSISYKWSIILGLMVIALLLIGLVINHFFFYDYYLSHEKNDMLSFSRALDEANGDAEVVEELIYEMTNKKQVTIGIVTDSATDSFDYNLLKRHLSRGKNFGAQPTIDYPEDSKKQLEEEGYFFLNISESLLKLPQLALIYQLSSGEVLLISMPLEVVNQTANIAIKFNVMIAGVLILLSMVVVYFLSKSMTKPIISLSNMAKQISELDFSQRFEGQSKDEMGALGAYINDMSQTLENTLHSLKKSNDQLTIDLAEKEKIVQMRKSFIANISHELKTPIALVMSYTEGIRDNKTLTDEDKKQYLEVIEKEAYHMDHLVKDLLDLTELEYDASSLNIGTLDFSSLIDETLDPYYLWIKEKQLKIHIDKKDMIMIQGDKKRLGQALGNLIINGLDHCPKEGYLSLGVEEEKESIKFKIYNSGSKLDEKNNQELFHRFYKGDVKVKRTLGGSGIGLSILAAVIEKHHGKYGAENKDEGVEFWFEIPKV